MLKVLMLSWEYPPHNVGGLGKHVMELVPALAQLGIEVHLLTPRWPNGRVEQHVAHGGLVEDVTPELIVHRVPAPVVQMTEFFTGAIRTNQILEQYARELIATHGDFDLIHAHDWLVAYAATGLKQGFKLPLLATIHATEYGRYRGHITSALSRAINNVEWWLTFEAWRVITCSTFMADEVSAALNVPADKIDVIPNGVDTQRFDQYDGVDLASFRASYAAPDEQLIFNVGRVVHEKGAHLLVDAMPRILAERPNARTVIAGNGGYLAYLRSRAVELGVSDRITLTGFIADEDRDRLFRVCDVAVFPSLYEPFGIVALEAMAAKAPVVVSQTGGLAEVVTHGETGLYVYPDNVESVAWGVLNTLNHPDQARTRAERAYQVVHDDYNWRRIAEQTYEVYDRIVGERRVAVW